MMSYNVIDLINIDKSIRLRHGQFCQSTSWLYIRIGDPYLDPASNVSINKYRGHRQTISLNHDWDCVGTEMPENKY